MGLGLGQCSIISKWEANTCVHSGETVHHSNVSWPSEMHIVAGPLAISRQY